MGSNSVRDSYFVFVFLPLAYGSINFISFSKLLVVLRLLHEMSYVHINNCFIQVRIELH